MNGKKKFRRAILAAIFAGSFIFVPQINGVENIPVTFAEVKTYTGVGDCVQNELTTAAQAKNYAKARAELNAKEKAGVYIRDYTKMQNFNLTENKIEVITSSILNIVGDVKYSVETMVWGNSPLIKHIASLKANIDTDGLNAYIRRKDGGAKSEIQSGQKDIKDGLNKIDTLIERYNKATTQAEKNKIRAEFNDADKKVLAGQKLNEGNEFAEHGNYQDAIRFYNEALKLNPNYAEAYNNRGCTYSDLQQYDKAIADYNKALQLNPNDAYAYNNRGNAYRDLQQYEAAITDFNKALQINPNYADTYYNRGLAYQNLKQYSKAIVDYNKALQLNPNDAEAYNNRGSAYRNLKQYDKAISDYNKALQLGLNHEYVYHNRGIAYALSGNLKQAIIDATKAIELNPNYASPYQMRGICYQALGETEKANADFAKAKKLGYKG